MINPNFAVRAAALIAVTTLAAGCAQLGAIDQILGAVLGQPGADGQRTGQAVVQVQSVNTRQQVINIATQDGQRGGVRYDQSPPGGNLFPYNTFGLAPSLLDGPFPGSHAERTPTETETDR